MAVASVGTPVLTRSTTSPVTGTWGTGQNRTAGNLLVAAVSAGAATSVTTITASGSWAAAGVQAAEGHTQVAFFTLTATGGDAAPSFSSTLASTAAMSATLFEFTGANTSSPVDTSGTTGLTGTTANPLTVTTAANVAASGEYALCCHTELIAVAGTSTWTQDAAFTDDGNDGATSSRIHAAVDHLAGPTSGATVSCGGSWATAPSHCAAQIIVIAANTGSGAASIAAAGAVTALAVQGATGTAPGAGSVTAAPVQGATGTAAGAGAVTASGAITGTASITGSAAATAKAVQGAGSAAAGAAALSALAAQQAIAAAAAAGQVTATGTSQVGIVPAAGSATVTDPRDGTATVAAAVTSASSVS